jgi:hypothetical protein
MNHRAATTPSLELEICSVEERCKQRRKAAHRPFPARRTADKRNTAGGRFATLDAMRGVAAIGVMSFSLSDRNKLPSIQQRMVGATHALTARVDEPVRRVCL